MNMLILPSTITPGNNTWQLQGKQHALKGTEYVIPVKVSGGVQCLSAFSPQDIPSPRGKLWVLGDAFNSVYYTVYDFGRHRVGFARGV